MNPIARLICKLPTSRRVLIWLLGVEAQHPGWTR